MRWIYLAACVAAGSYCCWASIPEAEPAVSVYEARLFERRGLAIEVGDDQAQILRKGRLNIAISESEALWARYAAGYVSEELLLDAAQNRLLPAGREALKGKERVEFLEQYVDYCRRIERHIEAKLVQGAVSRETLFHATYIRQTAQIEALTASVATKGE